MTTGVTVLVTHPSLPVSSVKELVAYAKQKGNLSYGSAGNGTISHLSGELFNQVAGVKMMHILPYKSAGFALTALLSNEVPVSYLSPITAHTQLKAGPSSPEVVVSAPGTPPSQQGGLSGHVLLVEDNPVNRQVASRLLTLSGLSLDSAENGQGPLDRGRPVESHLVLRRGG